MAKQDEKVTEKAPGPIKREVQEGVRLESAPERESPESSPRRLQGGVRMGPAPKNMTQAETSTGPVVRNGDPITKLGRYMGPAPNRENLSLPSQSEALSAQTPLPASKAASTQTPPPVSKATPASDARQTGTTKEE
jgi:hypothetical protein